MRIEAYKARKCRTFVSQYPPTTIFKSGAEGYDFQIQAKAGRARLTSAGDGSGWRDPNL
jgi:hypothetical protein